MRLGALAIVVLLATGRVDAQEPAAKSDFAVLGHLDAVVALNGGAATADTSSALTTALPFWIGGWTFEWRSGLMPQTQRVGSFFVYFTRVHGVFGEVAPSTVLLPITVVARPDVPAAFQATCPSVGPNVGYWALVTPPDEWGLWTMHVDVMTFDGAGNMVWMPTQERDVFVWPGLDGAARK